MGVPAGDEGLARRRAERAVGESPLEPRAACSEAIQVGGPNPVVAVGPHRMGGMVVCADDQHVPHPSRDRTARRSGAAPRCEGCGRRDGGKRAPLLSDSHFNALPSAPFAPALARQAPGCRAATRPRCRSPASANEEAGRDDRRATQPLSHPLPQKLHAELGYPSVERTADLPEEAVPRRRLIVRLPRGRLPSQDRSARLNGKAPTFERSPAVRGENGWPPMNVAMPLSDHPPTMASTTEEEFDR